MTFPQKELSHILSYTKDTRLPGHEGFGYQTLRVKLGFLHVDPIPALGFNLVESQHRETTGVIIYETSKICELLSRKIMSVWVMMLSSPGDNPDCCHLCC